MTCSDLRRRPRFAAMLALALGSGLPGLTAPARADLFTGLEAYYQFNGDGADASGQGLDLGLFGGAGFGAGLFGQALSLSGDANQYAARPISDESLNFGTGDFTIQAWVNYNTTGGEQVLLEKWTGAGGPGWTLTKLGGNEIILANLFFPQGTPLTITAGVWHQVVMRRQAGQFDLFFDNVVQRSGTSFTPLSTDDPLLIGRRNAADGRGFGLNGRLDEVAIWSRGLSNGEIASLYNGGLGQPIAVPEPSGLAMLATGLGLVALANGRHRRRSRHASS